MMVRPITKEYAIYKGEQVLAMGTAKECAETLGVEAKTIYYYLSPAYQRKGKPGSTKRRIAIRLNEEEE